MLRRKVVLLSLQDEGWDADLVQPISAGEGARRRALSRDDGVGVSSPDVGQPARGLAAGASPTIPFGPGVSATFTWCS